MIRIIHTVVCLLLFSLLQAQHSIDKNWYSVPKVFSPSQVGAKCGGAVANNMVVTSSGAVIIFYKENNKNYWAGSTDGGVTWTNPTPSEVPPCKDMIGVGTIAADNDTLGNIHIIWKATSPLGLFYAQWNVNTKSWSNYTKVNQTIVSSIAFSQITVDRKNRLHVMWQDGDHTITTDTAGVYYARSTNYGATWSNQVNLSENNDGNPDAFPVADFSGTSSDTLCIAWRQNTNTNSGWDVVGARTTNGGSTWESPITLSGGSHHQWDPNIVIGRDNIIHLFHHVYPNPNPTYTASIHYKYSTDGGNSWSALQTLSDTKYRSHLIKTAYDYLHNMVWCFWKDERDFNFTTGNPQADIIGCSVQHSTMGIQISVPEFISDGDTTEYGYHNFKVGGDGIVRAHFLDMINGQGNKLYYTQRQKVTAVSSNSNIQTVTTFTLLQNYPNPFNPTTTISFVLQKAGSTILKIYDMIGREVTTLVNDNLEAGVYYQQTFDASKLSSGIYIARLTSAGQLQTRKMMLMK